MNKQTNYYLLSGALLATFLVLEFTDIYGDSGWFKVFILLLAFTFLISGIAIKMKKKDDNSSH